MALAYAIAEDHSPSQAPPLSERLRGLAPDHRQPPDNVAEDTPAPDPRTPQPAPPTPSSPCVCLHCGTMLQKSLLPTCPICRHTGFLRLLGIPQTPLPPELTLILPSLPKIAPGLPPATLLAALPMVVD